MINKTTSRFINRRKYEFVIKVLEFDYKVTGTCEEIRVGEQAFLKIIKDDNGKQLIVKPKCVESFTEL